VTLSTSTPQPRSNVPVEQSTADLVSNLIGAMDASSRFSRHHWDDDGEVAGIRIAGDFSTIGPSLSVPVSSL
jgi:hypothetical protein